MQTDQADTHLAFVGALAGVGSHVAVQLAGMFKGAIADVTLVGALLGVDAAVHIEVLLDAEGFLAELTPEERIRS